MNIKKYLFIIFFSITKTIAFSDFDQNKEDNSLSFILGKGDQLNYENNSFIWSPKFKYSSFSTFDIGKGYKLKFNYGVKIDKFGIKLDSTNLNFDLHKFNLVVGIYRNIISQTRVSGITCFIKPCNYFNFFIGLEMPRRTKYLLDKNKVNDWKERKYGTQLEDFIIERNENQIQENDKMQEDAKYSLPYRYGRFSQIVIVPTFSAGLILKSKNDKINFCLGGIFALKLVYPDIEFEEEAGGQRYLSARLLLQDIKQGWLDKLEISAFYCDTLGEYSKYHIPQKFKINKTTYTIPVSYVMNGQKKKSILKVKTWGVSFKTVHNIGNNISLSLNIDFLQYNYFPEKENFFYSNGIQENNILVHNIFYPHLDFKYTIPKIQFVEICGGVGLGRIKKIIIGEKGSPEAGDLFWNARIGFGVLIDKLIYKKNLEESLGIFEEENTKFLDVLGISYIYYGIKIKQTVDWGRNPYEYYRRGWSHPLELHPYCDIIFKCNEKNKIILEICGDLNNKIGHGWEKENWIFKCIDKINLKWENSHGVAVFAGFGNSIVNDITNVWRLGIKHNISKIVSWSISVEKPRKSWKIKREISILNENQVEKRINKDFEKEIFKKFLLDINDYKNCDDSFLTGLRHPGFSCAFNFNFKKDILIKIGAMWKPFNENKDNMTDVYDCLKGIIYFETQVKGFSFKCTLNRAAGCYSQIENCNICCGGFGFIPPEFCIGPDCYYQNSIYIKEKKIFKSINKTKNEFFKQIKYEELEDVQKKLHYITTIDFQIMYSFKISKKREDTIFLRLNYLHCFTKYDKVMSCINDLNENDRVEMDPEIFYDDNIFQKGVRDDLLYLVLGTNIFIKPFLKVFVEFSFGFSHGLFNKYKDDIIQQCKKSSNDITIKKSEVDHFPFPKFCCPILIFNWENSLWGMKIGFECDLGKYYSKNIYISL